MVPEIVITAYAERNLAHIINYIHRKFGNIAVDRFIELFTKTLAAIQDNPDIGMPTVRKQSVRQYVMHSKAVIYYQMLPDDAVIKILSIWDTRRNPALRKF